MDSMFAKARGGGRLQIGPQDGLVNWVSMFSKARVGCRLQMGPQDGSMNRASMFLRLGVEAGSDLAHKMGWRTGFNVFQN